jgi:hypothetical protein
VTTLIGTGVHDESVQPRIEPIGITERGKLLPRVDQRLLHRILRLVRAAQDQSRDGVEAVDGGLHEDFERLEVAALRRLDEVALHPFPPGTRAETTRPYPS